jgi:hypothetical protein
MIERAYAETDLFMPDVVAWLKAGSGLLWIAADENNRILMALTTSLEQRPSGLSCRLVANGGSDLDQWKGLMPNIEEYARSQGCTKIVFDGRQGWARVFTDFAVKKVTLERVL